MKMIIKTQWNKFAISMMTTLIFLPISYCQNSDIFIKDTLKLDEVIIKVVNNNLIIKESEELVGMSELAVKLEQSAWLPAIDVTGSYSKLAPIPSFDIPNIGHIQMTPNNNISVALEVKQLLYDFGKTSNTIAIKEVNSDIASLTIEQIKDKFALSTAEIYYALYYIQESQRILKEHLRSLKLHLEYIQNKQKTGSATQYEILATQVKLSTAETQLSELETVYQIQLNNLATLMNSQFDKVTFVADTNMTGNRLESTNFEIDQLNLPELLILKKQEEYSQLNLKLINSQNLPTLGLFGSGGITNGYLPDIESLKANMVVGVNLLVPIFDGNRKNIRYKIASGSLNQTKLELENTKRTTIDKIDECILQLELSDKKTEQSKIQVTQAEEAYKNAEINYKEGAITNLELILVSDMLADVKLQLLKNKIDYQINAVKYKASLGEKLY